MNSVVKWPTITFYSVIVDGLAYCLGYLAWNDPHLLQSPNTKPEKTFEMPKSIQGFMKHELKRAKPTLDYAFPLGEITRIGKGT